MIAAKQNSIKALLLAVGLVVIITPNALSQKWGDISDEEWQLGAPEQFPEANVVMLFDKSSTEIDPFENIEFKRHARIKILNKAGIEELGEFSFKYYEDDDIKGLKAHTISPDGKKHKVSKKDFFKKTADNWEVISFAFPQVDSGCILEFSYRNVNERFRSLDPWYFQSEYYTIYSEYSLCLAGGLTYSTTTARVPDAQKAPVAEQVLKSTSRGPRQFQKFTWSMNDLVPIKDEPYMSFPRNYMAAIYPQLVSYNTGQHTYSYSRTWKEIGESWQEFIDKYVDNKKKLRKLADSLTAGIADDTLRVKRLYRYVAAEYADNGENKWMSNDDISDLLKTRSGTIEEKNILLIELIKALGIQAWPVLIASRNSSHFVPDFCQDRQFNHMLVLTMIDSVYKYLDVTLKHCPYGILPENYRTSNGLIIDGEDSEIVRVIYPEPDTYRIDFTKMHVYNDGSAQCSTSVKFSGYFAIDYCELHDKKSDEDFIKDYFLDKLDVEYEYDNPVFSHDSAGFLTMDVTYRLSDYARILDENIIVKPMQYRFFENPFKNEKRFFPVDFNYPFMYQNIVEITFEDSLDFKDLPDAVTYAIEGASFKRTCMFDGKNVVVDSKLTVEKPLFLQILYPKLRDFFVQVASSTEDEVVMAH